MKLAPFIAWLFLTHSSFALPGQVTNLYTIPNSTFYLQPKERITTINDSSGSIDILQQAIDTARADKPNRLLLINLRPTNYLITSNPLTLSSKMCLSGTNDVVIRAANAQVSAKSLIKIADGSSYVSVNFLTLDGNQADLAGVEGTRLNRISLDQLRIRQTGQDGITLQGLGKTNFNNEITVSRCDIANSPQASCIHLSDTTQALCLDNLCQSSSYGILLESSAHATLVNNRLSLNTVAGICLTNSHWSKVTHNLFSGNSNGISLLGSTNANRWNFIVSNEFQGDNSTGIALGGYGNVIHDNLFDPALNSPLVLLSDTGVNRIFTTSTPLSATGQEYFYPPTALNPHTNPIMNGKDRTNITTSATTLSAIQTTYDTARTNNPNHVIVLRLTAPTITGDAPLALSSNTCVLLDGTIWLNSGISAFSATNRTFLSISGGTVDGQSSTGRNGLTFSNCSRFIIDQVNWLNFGSKTTRVTGSDVLALLSCRTPSIVQKCNLNGGAARGIWAKSGSGHILSDNSSANMNMDGIDVDAFASYSLVQFNSTFGNIRYGLFVEEAAKYNQLVGNLSRSNSMGINVYSSAVGPTAYNSFVANTCQGNARGIRTGGAVIRSTNSGIVTTKTNRTEHNFFFNNVIRDTPTSTNKSDAGICAQVQGGENYFSRHYLSNNSPDYSETNTAVFFNPPFSITPLRSPSTYLDWQTAQSWSTPSNLPEADPNKNGVPNLLEYALDLNPLSQNPPTLPLVGWDTSTPDGPWLTFTYRHNLKAQDLSYEILVSEDLQTWSALNVDEISTFFETVEANPDGDGSSELLRIRTLPNPTSNKLFLRLRVTQE